MNKKIESHDSLKVFILGFALVALFIPNLAAINASTGGDLTVTQSTNLSGNSATVSTPFNLIFTISNSGSTSTFSDKTTIFSTALSNKINYGTPTISKSEGVSGDIECKINGFFRKSLNCTAKNVVSVPVDGTIVITQKITPTAVGTFVNPKLGERTHCKVDYTSSVKGDVFESNENNNNCVPQSLSIVIDSATASGNNLILNPSVEIVDPTNTSFPENWVSSYWGTNNTVFTYPVAGLDSAKAISINISSYTNGDARWEFKEIPVKPLETYTFSDWYKSNTTTYPIVRFTMGDGSFYYFALRAASSSPEWKQFSETFRVPFAAKAMSVSHTLNSVGTLSLDKYSLVKLP